MNYLQFFKRYPRLLGFAFSLNFFASFGQTIFISIYLASFMDSFDLTKGEFGTIYSIATFAGSFILLWIGKLLDKYSPKKMTLFTAIAFGISCLFISQARDLALLFLGLMGLRLTGQGLMGLITVTTMSKYFGPQRGKALSLTNLARPIGEAILPLAALYTLKIIDWRQSWLLIGICSGLMMIVMVHLLIKKQEAKGIGYKGDLEHVRNQRQWTRGEVLSNSRFYLVIALELMPAFILTSFFLFQGAIAELKGWSIEWMATSFVAFSLTRSISGFAIGPIVDRLGAKKIYPTLLIPLAMGLFCLQLFDFKLAAPLYLGLAGLTVGAGQVVKPAYWAECYGIAHLGALRSVVTFLIVVGTSISPLIFGQLLDNNVPFHNILSASLVAIMFVTVLSLIPDRFTGNV